MQQPLIFDIKRYAINDGPGIRLTIFFKGCSLACAWCHNPESISAKQQKLFTRAKCIGCGVCVKVCPEAVIELAGDGIVTAPDKCTLCGRCADICPTRAIEMSGRYYELDELLEIAEKERVFFDQSGGGVTISGGEPLLHADYLQILLKAFGERGIHRAVDTSGYCAQTQLLEVARHTDLFLFDLKLIDSDLHKKFTGVSNARILENLQALAASGAPISLRVPLIAGINDDDKNICEMADFVASLPGKKMQVHLLPYHGVASHKYAKLGGVYAEGEMREPSAETLAQIEARFAEQGIGVVFGG